MDRQEILGLYEWVEGVCFRHPGLGRVPTAVVGVIHPRKEHERQVRACENCVVTMEDIRREGAARAGGSYTPGQLGDTFGR